jgi:hypothetical protein
MGAGRPLKFTSVEELENRIEEYFKSCWEEVWIEKTTVDKNGKAKKAKWEQVLDRLGKPVLRQIRPYTITGLALYLDTSRQTLINYEEKEEFFDTIKKAKDRCENFLEEGMIKGVIPPAAGCFTAKNNYGWSDKQEISADIGNKDGKPFEAVSNLTTDELKKIIDKL